MLFNSIQFAIFLPIVFLLYWFVFDRFIRKSKWQLKLQNVFLLMASYFFYGYADWKMLPLLMVATAVFYFLGIAISQSKSDKKASWLRALGVMLGVGLLLYFKYLNFFIESFSNLFESMGLHTNWHTFNIIMPLGVSFFTFRLISYVIDVYNGEVEPTLDVVEFATYIAFFPCILSGPIDKPKFINQLHQKREFNYDQAVDGMRQILWGLFKKIVVADNCAVFVDRVFSSYTDQAGSTLLLGAIFSTFQMYADFSGYSDMAIGVGKLLGFSITRNFNNPFFALNVADFWRRWHMSLTSWLTDYVFTPLNFQFRRWGKVGMILAIIINMVVVGLWHEANWTFVVFGLYHGLLFVPLVLSGAFLNKDQQLRTNKIGLPVLKDFGRIVLTFAFVVCGCIIIRSESIEDAWNYFLGMIQLGTIRAVYRFFSWPGITPSNIFIVIMLVIEWLQREKQHGLEKTKKFCLFHNEYIGPIIYVLALIIFLIFEGKHSSFIYFQY
ncbi:MAG: MBOAT family protein [Bacteroidales bacterium]|nr:MBOAT family protein [Bacteroidales bacterium]